MFEEGLARRENWTEILFERLQVWLTPLWFSTNCSATVYLRVSVSAERDSPTGSSTLNSSRGSCLHVSIISILLYYATVAIRIHPTTAISRSSFFATVSWPPSTTVSWPKSPIFLDLSVKVLLLWRHSAAHLPGLCSGVLSWLLFYG